MTIKQLPSFIISFLDLIPSKDHYVDDALDKRDSVFLLGSILLRKICTENIWAQ